MSYYTPATILWGSQSWLPPPFRRRSFGCGFAALWGSLPSCGGLPIRLFGLRELPARRISNPPQDGILPHKHE